MARTTVILVGDDREVTEKLKTQAQGMGCTVHSFGPGEWQRGLNDPNFRSRFGGEVPALSVGSSPLNEGAKILQFPQPGQGGDGQKVRTINELESIAIENAIHEYGGNLTEAAKALGIGRATLYRKVKQYNIDPSNARKKRAA
jgi:transcriptional regulator of acetoin/glycerol metabolism